MEEGKIEEGAFGDLLSRMENNTRMAADILTVITLAKEDKEGNAEKAVELLMKNHNLSKEAAIESVTRIFKKAFEWVDSVEEGKKEYYGAAESDDAAHINALEKDMKDDKDSSMKIKEVVFPMWQRIK